MFIDAPFEVATLTVVHDIDFTIDGPGEGESIHTYGSRTVELTRKYIGRHCDFDDSVPNDPFTPNDVVDELGIGLDEFVYYVQCDGNGFCHVGLVANIAPPEGDELTIETTVYNSETEEFDTTSESFGIDIFVEYSLTSRRVLNSQDPAFIGYDPDSPSYYAPFYYTGVGSFAPPVLTTISIGDEFHNAEYTLAYPLNLPVYATVGVRIAAIPELDEPELTIVFLTVGGLTSDTSVSIQFIFGYGDDEPIPTDIQITSFGVAGYRIGFTGKYTGREVLVELIPFEEESPLGEDYPYVLNMIEVGRVTLQDRAFAYTWEEFHFVAISYDDLSISVSDASSSLSVTPS